MNRIIKALLFKGNIKSKMLIIGVGIPLASLLIFALVALDTIRDVEEHAVKHSTNLGFKAGTQSSKALTKQAEHFLMHIVNDQAQLSEMLIKRIEIEVELLSESVIKVMNPQIPLPQEPVANYSYKDVPPNPRLVSVYGLAPGTSMKDVKDQLQRSAHLDKDFKYIADRDQRAECILVAFDSGLTRYFPWTSKFNPAKESEKNDRRRREWYQAAAKSKGKLVWSNVYTGLTTNLQVVTCSKGVFTRDGRLLGVVAIDLLIDTEYDKILKTQLGDLGFAFLFNSNGELLDYPGSFSKKEQEELHMIAKQKLVLKSNRLIRKIGGEEKIIAFAPIPSQNWHMAIVLPLKHILEPIIRTKNQIALDTEEARVKIGDEKRMLLINLTILFVVIACISIFLVFLHARRIIEPIEKLDKGAAILGSGNLDHHLDINTGDELETMADAFNKMTADLKAYMKNLAETTAAKERIESDLRVATDIQASMLPRIFPAFPNRREFDIYAIMEPAKEVGGDFYDFFLTDNDRLFFLVADVSGKGVPAALFMVISKTLIKTEALRNISPLEVLENVNRTLCPDNDECMFVTTFCAAIDLKTGELEYANAGHNPPLLYRKGESFEYLKMGKSFVLGTMETAKFSSGGFTMNPGDRVFIYSDGVTEAMNESDELYSEKRLHESLQKLKDEPAGQIVAGVRSDVAAFVQNAPQSDDITILELEFYGPKGKKKEKS